jgi:hypothetical protein
MRLEIQLPKKIEVDDYHEFFRLREHFKILNKKIKVLDAWFTGTHYVGMIYEGSLTWRDPENMLMLQKIQKIKTP